MPCYIQFVCGPPYHCLTFFFKNCVSVRKFYLQQFRVIENDLEIIFPHQQR